MDVNRSRANFIASQHWHLGLARAREQWPEREDRDAVASRKRRHAIALDCRRRNLYDRSGLVDLTTDVPEEFKDDVEFADRRHVLKKTRLVGEERRHHHFRNGVLCACNRDLAEQRLAALMINFAMEEFAQFFNGDALLSSRVAVAHRHGIFIGGCSIAFSLTESSKSTVMQNGVPISSCA